MVSYSAPCVAVPLGPQLGGGQEAQLGSRPGPGPGFSAPGPSPGKLHGLLWASLCLSVYLCPLSPPSLTPTPSCPLPDPLPTLPAGSWASRIIGGHKVTPHSRPYMASVRFQGQHHCGGFLLRTRWVVSAAHCFSDR